MVYYGFVGGDCTTESCPKMTAGPSYEYFWPTKDGKKECLDAPSYIEKLFAWVAESIDNEDIFSTEGEYSKKFMPTVKKILARMFRV